MRVFVGRRSRVRLSRPLWDDMILELGRRSGGERESGAFLLARTDCRRTTVERVEYFDDLDARCLTGGVTFHSSGFERLWAICMAEGLRVIADVHTHGGTFVRQSSIDRANPMVATAGHVALIVPHLAQQSVSALDCGVHIYLGAHKWDQALGRAARRSLYIGRWA
jgi:proteasome lid subunit RPN8/RPN11